MPKNLNQLGPKSIVFWIIDMGFNEKNYKDNEFLLCFVFLTGKETEKTEKGAHPNYCCDLSLNIKY